ncbi:SDR family NAD(P)-dependent oxidoreductase [Actinoplanes sp. Pm04-4]|uniref:SDR family NAD(P)-dependent oxidoreductase n=1 Tax=Paractinoplanes pyxinae TaxID=2997416 RepID=A0ABT4ASI2_9ACTN|nr:SDR family NAD(P)-dependent oxidoreductase [Actinoplanes pyxinae]MCY1136365.1 SDR family NAD(P)-dependent oxidoreductase [Actinoplanes pyxinae]
MNIIKRWVRIAAGITGRGPRERRLRAVVDGRIVLVTGASEGIGAATARRLAAAGATVLLVARTRERLKQVSGEIAAAGGRAFVHPADLSSPEAAAELAADLVARYRRIDVVVNNAGRSIRRPVAETADRFHDIQRTASLNYLGPVQLMLVLLPAMRATGGGHVVNVSTAGLSLHTPNWSAYHASKAAFDTWLRSAAVEMRRDGITVSTVYCNLVRTRMSAPTPHFRRAPAMSADEAAGIVCRAVAHHRSWWPWWARIGSVVSAAMPRTVERALAAGVRALDALEPLRVLAASGLLRPQRLVRVLRAGRRGRNLDTALAAGPPNGLALVDPDGPVTYPELDAMAEACVANAAATLGLRTGDRVGLACDGHRGFVAVAIGLARLGVDVVLLPPDLPRDRLTEVLRRERATGLVGEPGGATGDVTWMAWPDLLAGPVGGPRSRTRKGRMSVLTSGTTGVPRSVSRPLPLGMLLGPVTTHLRLTPVRPGEPIVVATPPHHGYGLTYLAAGLTLGAPVVLVPGGDPERILSAVAEHGAGLMFVLPIQLRRMAELPAARWPALDSLRGVVSGAAALPPDLCELFPGRLFNMYATTEAGWASMATPADLRAAPGTVGRAPRGVRIRVVEPGGTPLPPNRIGEIQVRGWHPDGQWLATGDLGHLDPAGRLFVDGRLDDMIVSGGENVYAGPVAAILTSHPDVADALLEPVADPEFGQRLRATVEVLPGRTLTAAELRKWLDPRLSRAERPRDITVVAALPRTATGKLVRSVNQPKAPTPGR